MHSVKLVLGIKLLPGSTHSAKGFLKELKVIVRELAKVGIQAIFRADSAYHSAPVCNFIEESGHYFIFAVRASKAVRKRGKNAKGKQIKLRGTTELKERIRHPAGDYDYRMREIFVKVRYTPDGQMLFDFEADQFTNIIMTNLKCAAVTIYKSYKAHAAIETIIEELKNDFGAGLAHSHSFHVNATMTVCSALAYNVKNHFVQKNGLRINHEQSMKLSTLQAVFIHTPGSLVKNGNDKALRIPKIRLALFNRLAA